MSPGSAGAGSTSPKPVSASVIPSTTKRCSERFLAEASSPAARRSSASGLSPRGAVPARAVVCSRGPSRVTSSSGVGPEEGGVANREREGRAGRIAASQPVQHGDDVQLAVEGEGAGQDHLVELASLDRVHSGSHKSQVLVVPVAGAVAIGRSGCDRVSERDGGWLRPEGLQPPFELGRGASLVTVGSDPGGGLDPCAVGPVDPP